MATAAPNWLETETAIAKTRNIRADRWCPRCRATAAAALVGARRIPVARVAGGLVDVDAAGPPAGAEKSPLTAM